MNHFPSPIYFGIALFFLLPQNMTQAQHSKAEASLTDKLAGTWQSTDGDGYQEHWDLLSPGHLKGFGASAKNEKRTVLEYLEIKTIEGGLTYIAEVLGQNEGRAIHFNLNNAQSTDNYFLFKNPKHDFPRQIAYRFIANDILEIKLSGKGQEDMHYSLERAKEAASNGGNLSARYTDYNRWANALMAEWLSTATDEQMQREINSSFNSLRSTVLHIWSAEYLWLQVLKGESYEDNPTRDYLGSTQELLTNWLQASESFHSYVATLSTDALKGKIGSSGDRAPLDVIDIIQHCMNHSTYHRGQLITMGRQAGLDTPPQTDFIFYVRQSQQRK